MYDDTEKKLSTRLCLIKIFTDACVKERTISFKSDFDIYTRASIVLYAWEVQKLSCGCHSFTM